MQLTLTEPICKQTGLGHRYNLPQDDGEMSMEVNCKLCGEPRTHYTRKAYGLAVEGMPVSGSEMTSTYFRRRIVKVLKQKRKVSMFNTCEVYDIVDQ